MPHDPRVTQILERLGRLEHAEQADRIELESLSHDRNHDDILHELREILHELRRIEHDLHPQPPPPPPPTTLTRSIAVMFSGDSPMPNNALTLNVGQTSQASIQPLLIDGLTPSGGTLSDVSYSFADPSATAVLNADNLTATITGVAPSTGAVSGVAAATVTDTDGVVSQWSQAFTITTLGIVPPQQITQSVAVQFSTPTP